MAKKKIQNASEQVVLRVPTDIIRRVDDLCGRFERKSDVLVMGRITRSAVMRLALERGLDAIEKEHK